MLKRLSAFFLDTLQIIVFAVSIFLFVYLLILRPALISGQSMEPNFDNNEYLLTEKVTYDFNKPKRGDVIVFKAPPLENDQYIKRIIGLPGESVMVKDCKVYVNNVQLDETKYLKSTVCTNPGTFLTDGATLVVPVDSYFVLGDNRPVSLDSRFIGFINKSKFTGLAWVIYWPLNKIGTVKRVTY